MKLVIYDTEIRHGVVTDNNPAQPVYKYADGWHDFAGMGVSTICAYDIVESRNRVFLADNMNDWEDLITQRDAVIGFNNHYFDDKLLEANDILNARQSIDLAALIWAAAGIPPGEHPKGLGLDAICRANKLPGKTGNGADAPQNWQEGYIGAVVDYCLADVRSTLNLYRYLATHSGVKDPRDGKWLTVVVPK